MEEEECYLNVIMLLYIFKTGRDFVSGGIQRLYEEEQTLCVNAHSAYTTQPTL